MTTGTLVLLIIFLVFLAAFTVMLAGHDAPNSVALPVRFGALSPTSALILTAISRFMGACLASIFINYTTAELASALPAGSMGLMAVSMALLAAFAWGVLTWVRGVPISNSQALSAAMIGAALAIVMTGAGEIAWTTIADTAWPLLLGLVVSPVAGLALAWVLGLIFLWSLRDSDPSAVNAGSRITLAVSSAANALAHGAQHGARLHLLLIIGLGLAGLHLDTQWWIPIVLGLLMAIGTFLGGWRIAFTITERITALNPLRAAIASVSSAVILFVGSFAMTLPVSSTFTTIAAIVGVGHQQDHSSVRWIQVGRLVTYWLATLVFCLVVALILTAALTPVWTG